MISKRRFLFISIIIFDSILVILPIYDSFNLSDWIIQGLHFQRSLPAFQGSLNPAAFFVSIIIYPVSLAYSISQSIYISAIILKLILLIFFYMFAYLIYRFLIYYLVPTKIRDFIMLLTMLSPGILFITFIWAELDIVPVFFVTLSYYIFKIKPFHKKICNILISTLSLIISVFFFLYPLIFMPSYIIYSKKGRERIAYLTLFLVVGVILEIIQIKIFQGYFYNYFGSLSGSVPSLAPSGLPTGFFYYIHIYGTTRLVTELALIGIISIIMPVYLHWVKYDSTVVIYIVSALFIFISPTINMDNFLFILPFAFLSGIGAKASSMSKFKILWLSSLLFIPVIFAPLIYSHQNVYGLFYWFYPLTHFNGPRISPTLISNVILPAYNLLFMLFLYISITIALMKSKSEPSSSENLEYNSIFAKTQKNRPISKQLFAIFISIVLLSVPLAFIYNDSNNSVSINQPENFPLLYFYPESYENSSIYLPIGADSYSIHDNTLSIPTSTPSMLLERNLENQYFEMNATLTIHKNLTGPIIFSNLWSLQEEEVFNSSLITKLHPDSVNITGSNNQTIPILSSKTDVDHFSYGSNAQYNITSIYLQNHTLLWMFNVLSMSSSQSDPFYVIVGNTIIELAVYSNYAVIAHYTKSQGWKQTSPITIIESSFSSYNWHSVTMSMKNDRLLLQFEGVTYATLISNDTTNINIILGSPFGKSINAFSGFGTSLFSYNNSIIPSFNQVSIDYHGIIEPLIHINTNVTKIKMQFMNSYNGSELNVSGREFQMKYSSFIILGKSGGTGSLEIHINKMTINNLNSYGYFLVPVFMAFYLPIIFATSVVVYLTKK